MRAVVLLCALCLLALPAVAQGRTESIAAVVGDQAIPATAVAQRARVLTVMGGTPPEQAQARALDDLITEALQRGEAARLGLEIDPDRVARGFANIAKGYKMAPEQLRAAMRQSGMDPGTLEDKVRAEVAWAEVVEAEVVPRVSVSQGEVDAAYAQATARAQEADKTPPSRDAVANATLRAAVTRAAAAHLRAVRARTFVEER
jgi:peptidyl-prolyl cis-trans isomerase SurA